VSVVFSSFAYIVSSTCPSSLDLTYTTATSTLSLHDALPISSPGREQPGGHLVGDHGRVLERIVADHRAEQGRRRQVVVPGLVEGSDVRGSGEQFGAAVTAQHVAAHEVEVDPVEQPHGAIASAQGDDGVRVRVAPGVDEVGPPLLVGAGQIRHLRVASADVLARDDGEAP